jgi:beta-lactamase regulating signal transducer with metallopeptidase domain
MKMTAVLLLTLGVLVLLRHRSAALRHWVLATAVACAAMMPVLETVVPAWPLPFGNGAAASATSISAAPDQQAGTSSVTAIGEVSTDVVLVRPERQQIIASAAVAAIARSLWSIWVAGACVSFLILLTGLGRLTWLASRAHRMTQGRWRELADEISDDYGMQRPFLLLQSSHPSLLVTWGLVLPKIILPAAAADWSEERARVVLSHELAHIRRGDWIVQMAAELLRGVYWFNPVLWMVCRRLRLESEHACDDEVMNRGVEGRDYASHLIDLAKALNRQRHTWFPAPAMARPSSLERRVRAMLNDRLNRKPLGGITRAAIFVCVLSVVTAVAAAQNMFQTFSGNVVDATGRPVAGVTLVLESSARQAKYEVKSNDAGGFEFVGWLAGDYALEARAAGFSPLKDRVTLKGENVQRRLALRIGELQEQISVRMAVDDRESAAPPVIKEVPAPDTSRCVMSAMGGRITPPKKFRDLAPQYPQELRGTGTEGAVVLTGRIGLDGFITDIQTVGNPQPELVNATIAAVHEWRFSQTLLNCTPVEPAITITTNFRATPPPPPAPPKP